MAIGWLAVLQMVPWSDVIKNAPKVADGAKKLWKTVGNKSADDVAAPAAASAAPQSALSPDNAAAVIAALQVRVAALEDATGELHEQMLASSELIKALAEQNTQLIARAETNRVRTLWLAMVTAVLGVGVIAALTLAR